MLIISFSRDFDLPGLVWQGGRRGRKQNISVAGGGAGRGGRSGGVCILKNGGARAYPNPPHTPACECVFGPNMGERRGWRPGGSCLQ